MSKVRAKVRKELTEVDVEAVARALKDEQGAVRVVLHVEQDGYYPFKVTAEVWYPSAGDVAVVWSQSYYSTVRYPFLSLPMFKALQDVYTTRMRALEGLPPLQ